MDRKARKEREARLHEIMAAEFAGIITPDEREQMIQDLFKDLCKLPELPHITAKLTCLHGRPTLETARQAGELLIEAKQRLEHGQWSEWVKTHTSLSFRTAQVYIQVATHLRDKPTPTDLTIEQFLKTIC